MKEIMNDLDRWRSQGRRVALARVVDIEGSGPRLPGAAMAVGGILGVLGVTTGSTEVFVALSVVLLGVVLLALTGVAEARVLAGLVALAALFHGLAHGGEVPGTATPALYVVGFLLATAGLHLAGVALGPVVARSRVVRGLAGAGVVAAGLVLVGGV